MMKIRVPRPDETSLFGLDVLKWTGDVIIPSGCRTMNALSGEGPNGPTVHSAGRHICSKSHVGFIVSLKDASTE